MARFLTSSPSPATTAGTATTKMMGMLKGGREGGAAAAVPAVAVGGGVGL